MSISENDLLKIKVGDIISLYRFSIDGDFFLSSENEKTDTFEASVIYIYSEQEKKESYTSCIFLATHKTKDCYDGWEFELDKFFSPEEKNTTIKKMEENFSSTWKSDYKFRRYFISNTSCISGVLSATITPDVIGKNCIECNNFCKWAEANLIEKKFVCYSCRTSMGWKYNSLLVK